VKTMQAHPSFALVTRALLALLVSSAAALAVSAQEPAPRSTLEARHRAETRARYAQAEWPRGEVRGGLANELLLPGWRIAELEAAQGLLTRTYAHADVPEAPPSFVVESRVSDSAADAHESLVAWLAGVQSPQTMPALAEVGLMVGDAGFAGRAGAAPDALAWIAFVRGNVAVRISACDPLREPGLDLGAVATAFDLAIRSAPTLEAGRTRPAQPAITRLVAPRSTVVAGEVLQLDVAVEDPAGGAPHLEWTLGGPGQGYVERAADGTWQLRTTGPGALTVILEATGSNGTWTRGELRLGVLDD
jgi:hypothetical protein